MPNDPYLIGLPLSRLTDPHEIAIARAAHILGRGDKARPKLPDRIWA